MGEFESYYKERVKVERVEGVGEVVVCIGVWGCFDEEVVIDGDLVSLLDDSGSNIGDFGQFFGGDWIVVFRYGMVGVDVEDDVKGIVQIQVFKEVCDDVYWFLQFIVDVIYLFYDSLMVGRVVFVGFEIGYEFFGCFEGFVGFWMDYYGRQVVCCLVNGVRE